MDFSKEPLEGAYNGFNYSLENLILNTQDASPKILDFLLLVNTLINALVPIIISLALVAFTFYLVRYFVFVKNPEETKISIRGASRAFVAVFLMVNIWTIIRMIQDVFSISLSTSYFIFLFSFILFGFWSLFSIGDTLIAFISRFTNWFVDKCIAIVVPHLGESTFERRFKNTRSDVQHFIILILILSLLSVFTIANSVYLNFGDDNVAIFEVGDKSNRATEIPLGGATGFIKNNIYTNESYGFEVSFPFGWVVSTSSEHTITATRNEVEMRLEAFTVPPGYEFSTNLDGLGKDMVSNIVEAYALKGYGIVNLRHYYYDNYRDTVIDYADEPFYFMGLTVADPETDAAIFSEARIMIQNGPSYYTFGFYIPDTFYAEENADARDSFWSEVWDEIIPSVSFSNI